MSDRLERIRKALNTELPPGAGTREMAQNCINAMHVDHEWELIVPFQQGGLDNNTYKMKIPEGWLYRYGQHLVFVPA